MEKQTIDTIRETLNLISPNKYLFLIFNSQGRIVEFLNPNNTGYIPVYNQLKKTGSLSRFFDLSSTPKEERLVSVTERPESGLASISSPYITSLPRFSLVFRRIASDLFFGRIFFLDFQPTVSANLSYAHLILDIQKDTLTGFSPDFHSHFRDIYSKPEAMLQEPVSQFFTPSPAEFQKKMIPVFEPWSAQGFSPFFERDLSDITLWDDAIETTLRPDKRAEGAYWTNTGQTTAYLTILKPLDLQTHDFMVELSLEKQTGLGPYFVCGGRAVSEDEIPDSVGYMAGRTISEQGGSPAIQIKRNGFTTTCSLKADVPTDNETFFFCKTGHTMRLFDSQRREAAFYDSDFLLLNRAYLSLALRPGSGCVIRKVAVRVKKTALDNEPVRHIVKLIGKESRHFTLDRFYHATLAMPLFLNKAGFLINDITRMQKQIEELDLKYRTQTLREQRLKSRLKRYETGNQPFVGTSSVVNHIRETAEMAAASDATVLIEGPTGTGKEVLARYIHEKSKRNKGPFIRVDCATIPASLFESQLFGHEKGAFTGATARAIGLLERANQGTLFLDEAGNLSREAQTKLLQFLNDFTITRIGGTAPIKLDVRVVAASNVSLEECVRTGKFREDLYYRLYVLYFRLPPLCERPEDIPALARHFLAQQGAEQENEIIDFSPPALRLLMAYQWPGNIRELSNVIQRALLYKKGAAIEENDIQFQVALSEPSHSVLKKKRAPLRLAHTPVERVTAVLEKHQGHTTESARELGMSRAALYMYLRKHGVNVDAFRKGFGENSSLS